jgi:hypothetical protein
VSTKLQQLLLAPGIPKAAQNDMKRLKTMITGIVSGMTA